MNQSQLLTTSCLCLIACGAFAQDERDIPLPVFEIARLSASQTGGMDFESGNGELRMSEFELRSLLSRPLTPWEGVKIIPAMQYSMTQMNFIDSSLLPLNDEELHSLALQSVIIQSLDESKWSLFSWMRGELATDFQGIESEDFTFDIAMGASYRFNDTFNLGLGFVFLDLNGDTMIFPGVNFDWRPSEDLRVSLFGPNLLVKYDIEETWYISAEGQPGGGNWNFTDDAGQSRTFDVSSYQLSFNTHHRLMPKVWLNAGVGYTFGNQVEIRANRGGNTSFEEDIEGAPFANVFLSLKTW